MSLLAAASLLLALTLAPPAVEIQRLQPAAVREFVEKGEAVVIDVRGSVPYELGHLAGAVWMPLGLVGQRAAELPQDKLIVAYCTCKAEELSLEAGKILISRGFERVGVLVGGYPGWVAAGLPVASNRDPAPAGEPAGSGTSGGRFAPPAGVSCDRNDLTVHAGSALAWSRGEGKTTVTIRTSAGTTESVAIRQPADDDPARYFLFEGSAFLPAYRGRIENGKGELLPGLGIVAWVCADGHVWLDWRPGTKFQGAE